MKQKNMAQKKKAQGGRLVVLIIVLLFILLGLMVLANIIMKLMRE